MKNSPIIRVEDTDGDKININANHVYYFYEKQGKLVVRMANGGVYGLKCSERSFRGYMNKALGGTKEEKTNEE